MKLLFSFFILFYLFTKLVVITSLCPRGELIIQFENISIATNAFSNCSDLTSVSIPSTILMIGENVFSGSSSLTFVFLSDGLTIIGNRMFYFTGLKSIIIPSTISSIGSLAFAFISSLNCVYWKEIVVASPVNMFFGSNNAINCISNQKLPFSNDKVAELTEASDDRPTEFNVLKVGSIFGLDNNFINSSEPTVEPTFSPINSTEPTTEPTIEPTVFYSAIPTTFSPTGPSYAPTLGPTRPRPIRQTFTDLVTLVPSIIPTTSSPTDSPSALPTDSPTYVPTVVPNYTPSYHPSTLPSYTPSILPSTSRPSVVPSYFPSQIPSTISPSATPSDFPTHFPSSNPSQKPSQQPSHQPYMNPSLIPSSQPSNNPIIFRKNGLEDKIQTWILIIVAILLIIIVLILFLRCYFKKLLLLCKSCSQGQVVPSESEYPRLEWEQPSSIYYNTPLSSEQLSAQCIDDIDGDFTYVPVVGTILRPGQYVLQVRFTPTNTKLYHEIEMRTTLTVLRYPLKLFWTTPTCIKYGEPLSSNELNARCFDGEIPGVFTYDPTVGTILTPGEKILSVKFTPSDRKLYDETEKQVNLIVIKDTPKLLFASPITIHYGIMLSIELLNICCSDNIQGDFIYDPVIGTVLRPGEQIVNVTFTPTDVDLFNETALTVPIMVLKYTPKLVWDTPINIQYEEPLSLDRFNPRCADNIPGDFFTDPAEGAILPTGRHSVSLIFIPHDQNLYNDLNITFPIVVIYTPQIEWEPPASIQYGDPLTTYHHFNARCLDNISGCFVYNYTDGTILPPGRHSLSVRFTPTNRELYNILFLKSLIVVKDTPNILWNPSNTIQYGEPLSKKQLNAHCIDDNVVGVFEYSPTEGTILQKGEQTLSARFIPIDRDLYSETKLTASILVEDNNLIIPIPKHAPKLEWDSPVSIIYGKPLSNEQLNARCVNEILGTFTYDPLEGALLDIGEQLLSVTFVPIEKERYDEASMTISLTIRPKYTPTLDWKPSAIKHGELLSEYQLNAQCIDNIPGVFTYNPVEGTILEIGEYELNVTFTPSDKELYNESYKAVTLLVNTSEPRRNLSTELNWDSPTIIVYGEPLSLNQLNAHCIDNIPGEFNYNPAEGTLLGPGEYELNVTFTPTNKEIYIESFKKVTLTVIKYTPKLHWRPSSIQYGEPISQNQLNAYCIDNIPGDFEYNPVEGTVLKPGEYELNVTFTPTDREFYTDAYKVINLMVNPELLLDVQYTPQLEWNTPISIKYGDALSTKQLNARCVEDIPGVFSYNPDEGTLLEPGERTLSVNFTPLNRELYNESNLKVNLVVNKLSIKLIWKGKPSNAVVCINYGNSLGDEHFNATTTYPSIPGKFIYYIRDGKRKYDIYQISKNSLLTYSNDITYSLKPGDYKFGVRFNPESDNLFKICHRVVALKVERFIPTIEWNSPRIIEFGEVLTSNHLNATCPDLNITGDYSYNLMEGTLLIPGKHQLVATFVPHNEVLYAVVSIKVSLTVTKYTPKILWDSLISIKYGDPLSESHLQASCLDKNINGQFTYNRKVGEVLTPGLHELIATFNPNMINLFNPVHTSIFVTVSEPVVIYIPKFLKVFITEHKHENDDIWQRDISTTTMINATFSYIPINKEEEFPIGSYAINLEAEECDKYVKEIAEMKIYFKVVESTSNNISGEFLYLPPSELMKLQKGEYQLKNELVSSLVKDEGHHFDELSLRETLLIKLTV